MNDQRMKSKRRSALRALPVFMLVCLLAIFAMVVSVSAEPAGSTEPDAQPLIRVSESNLTFTGVQNTNGVYTKAYDGTTAVGVTLKTSDDNPLNKVLEALGIAAEDVDSVELTVSAAFNSADTTDASLIIVTVQLKNKDGVSNVAEKYALAPKLELAAKITPKKLTWSGNATASISYQQGVSTYNIGVDKVVLPAIDSLPSGVTASVSSVEAMPACNAGTENVTTRAIVALNNPNYTIDPVTVAVTVTPIVIDDVKWTIKDSQGNAVTSWTYGDRVTIEAMGYSNGVAYDILKFTPQDEAEADWAAGNAGIYNLKAAPMSNNFTLGAGSSKDTNVTIERKAYNVSMSDLKVIGDGKTLFQISVSGVGATLPQEVLEQIQYTILGGNGDPFTGTADYGSRTIIATLPTQNYIFYEKFSDGTQKSDVSSVRATLTVLRQEKMFPIVNQNGETVGSIILSNRDGFSDDVVATAIAINGYPDIIKNNRYNQTFKLAISGAKEGEIFTIIIPLSNDIYAPRSDIPTIDDLKIYEPATGTLVPARTAGKGYSVTLGDGFYQIDDYASLGEITFAISSDYNTPFFLTALGFAILIFLVMAVILLLVYIGLFLRRNMDTRENPMVVVDADGVLPPRTPIEVIQVPEREPVDEEALLVGVADSAEEAIDPDSVAAEEEELAPAEDEAIADETADALQILHDELADIELDAEEVEEEAEEDLGPDGSEELADSIAAALEETVDAEKDDRTHDDEVAVLVAEAMEEATAVNESADAEEAVELTEEEAVEEEAEQAEEEAVEEVLEEVVEEELIEEELDAEPIEEAAEEEIIEEVAEEAAEEMAEEAIEEIAEEVVEEAAEEAAEETAEEEAPAEEPKEESDEDDNDDDNDNDEDDDGDAVEAAADPFGFGMNADPSTFIDVKENPEAYQEMLERERRGEIRIVNRYKKSFTAKLAQSLGNVQDYYSELKNALLAYKGVKNRLSWNYEAFNKGRTHVAKMVAKARTLYLYLAINPEDLAETKYSFVDVSAKKKYASTPVLMKIKGERKFKHALELIAKMCGEQMELPRLEKEPVDYRVPRMTIEEMVEAGYIKHQAGYITLTPPDPDGAPVEEAIAVSADVTEDAVESTETEAVVDEATATAEAEVVEEATEEAVEETAEEAVEETAEEAVEETAEEAVEETAEEAVEETAEEAVEETAEEAVEETAEEAVEETAEEAVEETAEEAVEETAEDDETKKEQ